jgi:hypothetical protein
MSTPCPQQTDTRARGLGPSIIDHLDFLATESFACCNPQPLAKKQNHRTFADIVDVIRFLGALMTKSMTFSGNAV